MHGELDKGLKTVWCIKSNNNDNMFFHVPIDKKRLALRNLNVQAWMIFGETGLRLSMISIAS